MKLKPHPVTYNGGELPVDEFAFTQVYPATDPDSIVFHCRGNPPRPRICGITIVRGKAAGTAHGWDGNRDAPTITPSIGCEGRAGCRWHGHITNGDWTP